MTEQELDKMIARINELAHKSKKEGLTEEEAMEQTELRGHRAPGVHERQVYS